MTEFLFLNTADFGEKDYRRFFALCGEERREKVLRLRSEEDKRLSLLAEGALRLVLGRRLALPPEALFFAKEAGGKPYLSGFTGSGKDEKAEISDDFRQKEVCFQGEFPYFNFSHTKGARGGRLLLTISDAPVGCDTEGGRIPGEKTQGGGSPSPALLRKICSPSEIAYIGEGEGAVLRFADVWTAKEAYVKCIGVGIACDLRGVEVCMGEGDGCALSDTVGGLPLRHFCRDGFACAIVGGDEPLREVFWETLDGAL